MRFAIQGHVAMLDNETKEKIEAARERLFGRLLNRIAELDVRVDHSAQTGATSCQVNVRTANRIQVLTRHRDRDALKAVLTALERARAQIRGRLKPRRQGPIGGFSAVTP
jgi:ribosome-associated translation inhibitor RaiA